MKTKPPTTVRHAVAAVGLIAFLMLTGCNDAIKATSSSSMDGDARQQPGWVGNLREGIEEIPEHVDPEGPDLTPTVWPTGDEPPPRGVPADMTRPIAGPPRAGAPAPKASGGAGTGGTGDTGGHGTGLDQTLNITINNAEEDAVDTTAAAPRSTLETLYAGSFDRRPSRELDQFGYNFFEEGSEPTEIGPVPGDYVIGPDDEIVIAVWNGFDEYHRLAVERDGQISIPEIGSVAVAGQRFRDLPQLIRAAYAETRKDFELSVSLGQLRRIQVNVVGDVAEPGVIDVPAQASVLTALVAAGGPTKSGSLRQVELRRGNEITSVDLYDFLITGSTAGADLLHDGDVIFVPPIGPTVGVGGFVLRPGIYETTGAITVDDALTLAGGLTPFTFTPLVQIEKTVGGRGREIEDLALDAAGRATSMGDGELLLVGAVDDRMQPVVKIDGEVVRPGTYQFRKGMTVRELILQADGLTIDAYLPQAFISRQVGNADPLTTVHDRTGAGNTRRVHVIDLAKALERDPEHDLPLMPLDQLRIRSRNESTVRPTVTVIGPVKSPGTYELTAGLHVSDLIAIAGNLKPDVYYDEAELIRIVYDDVERELRPKRYRFDLGAALRQGGSADPRLHNGDQLVIRALRQTSLTVEVSGQVRFPGTYILEPDSQITDMIAAAGGVLGDADLRAAAFMRQSVALLQKERLDHLSDQTRRQYEAAVEKMVQTGGPQEGMAATIALIQVQELLGRMGQVQTSGRVVVPFLRGDFPESEFNLTLEDGDRLMIPRRQETVAIMGHVFNPTTFVAETGLTVSQVLDRAGGLTEFADDERLYVMRADGIMQSVAQRRGAKLSLNAELFPGDIVLVPRAPLERTFTAEFRDLVVLARQLAEAGVLFSHVADAPTGFDVTTILNPFSTSRVNEFDDTVLKKRR